MLTCLSKANLENFLIKSGHLRRGKSMGGTNAGVLVHRFAPEMVDSLAARPRDWSTGGAHMRPGGSVALAHKRCFCCAIRHTDRLGGNAWETDVADDDVRVLAKIKSVYNYLQVLEVSRRADHALAGCKLLLLDRPGNIQSVYNPYKVMTDSYYDVLATLPALLPAGPVGILGLGAGTAARIVRYFWPLVELHGWELDPSVVMVARQFFDMSELEQGTRLDVRASSVFELDLHPSPEAAGRLVVHVGDALEGCQAPTEDDFAGLIVDMFADGAVIPALQQAQTWQRLRELLKPGGRMMVNCGGSCVEADGEGAKDGEATMRETLEAMVRAFPPGEVFQFRMPGPGNNCVALTGPSPDWHAWEHALPLALRSGVYDWMPVCSSPS